MNPDVLVIGGGLAGLSAAVHLSTAGLSVLLVERNARCGGRVFSFTDPHTGAEVDNGQHLMLGCYRHTLRYLDCIGTREMVAVQPSLRIPFRDVDTGNSLLSTPRLPSPLHALSGLLRLKSLSLGERFALVRGGAALLAADPDKNAQLQSLTVDEWLDEIDQPRRCRTVLWDVLSIGMLNEKSSAASASLFVRTLQRVFAGKSSDASIVLPKRGLSRVFVDPALAYLAAQGAQVATSTTVVEILEQRGAVTRATLSDGTSITPGAVICAVPFFGTRNVAGGYVAGRLPAGQTGAELIPAPIVSIHLWYEREIVEEDFVALLNSPLHWIFNRSNCGKQKEKLHHLSLVISGAWESVGMRSQDLTAMAVREVNKFYPRATGVRLEHALVIKEKRATFSPRVGADRHRPDCRTSVSNLYLAGDWTATKLPATIEGAVQSGVEAAAAILRV